MSETEARILELKMLIKLFKLQRPESKSIPEWKAELKALRQKQKQKCKHCGALLTDGCECHAGNKQTRHGYGH